MGLGSGGNLNAYTYWTVMVVGGSWYSYYTTYTPTVQLRLPAWSMHSSPFLLRTLSVGGLDLLVASLVDLGRLQSAPTAGTWM